MELKNLTANSIELGYKYLKDNKDGSYIVDDKTITIGEKFHITLEEFPTYYVINSLEISQDSITIKEFPENQCTELFLSTISNFNKTALGVDTYLINSQISNDNKLLRLRYRYTPYEDFNTLYDNLKSNTNCIKVDNTDNRYVLFSFIIPIQFRKDVKSFLNNKYSKLSNRLLNEAARFYRYDPNSLNYLRLVDREKYKQHLMATYKVPESSITEINPKPILENELYTLG